ncbi:UvrD-helicase domain-containing protein [Streptomyces sp. SPB162]|uniref:UvrD-helicase domain-containing protein n=1 Tax=Streptomyces sp. SPB162 TaxID=2940560 RepID=UPI0024068FB5|nr:UvrD-helicase domain-containing protein [Streptomyces sp. SPB162]MDF9811841.1 DNA helicase-2/ATP-dependent DNA helicase PcrA [Streptomyces sp. SPB162]
MLKPRAGVNALTPRQLMASGSPHGRVYVEAEPGSGKTTVSAFRFGLHRFAGTTDRRAVVAVSFTRSATEELRARVIRHWGLSSVTWPHRIVTLDTLLCDLLFHLLQKGVLQWPGGHTDLEVLDTWRTALPGKPGRIRPVLRVDSGQVVIRTINESQSASHPSVTDFMTAVSAGRCTHDNVREALQGALATRVGRETLTSYLESTVRSLTVDEVFDANDLDRDILSLAASGCRSLTLVGDPWQALYQFRGARPAAMTTYISENGFTTHHLDESFRWGSDRQASLTRQLRQRMPVELPPGFAQDADVVIAHKWKTLWEADPHVLPLAIRPGVGQAQEAICTLLLNEITQRALGLQAVFLHDALATLGLEKEDLVTTLHPCLQTAIFHLKDGARPRQVWESLADSLADLIPALAAQRYARKPLLALNRLQLRLEDDQLVPGLTCHQSKGREWNTVAIKLSSSDASALKLGLDPTQADHRALYVALTRARLGTVALT